MRPVMCGFLGDCYRVRDHTALHQPGQRKEYESKCFRIENRQPVEGVEDEPTYAGQYERGAKGIERVTRRRLFRRQTLFGEV
jgi:hypothetical protein